MDAQGFEDGAAFGLRGAAGGRGGCDVVLVKPGGQVIAVFDASQGRLDAAEGDGTPAPSGDYVFVLDDAEAAAATSSRAAASTPARAMGGVRAPRT
ncbi:MAG TPA: hypothetical protein ENK57_10735 [Polyangiaceae bacterium]|nr:hypothetical protein [Polyangiaceae bacterium]